MINILIADDHKMFADGIETIFQLEPDMQVIGKTATGKGVFEILAKTKIDLLLLDVNLLDMTGIEVSKEVCIKYPDIKILVISMFNQESYVTGILKQGALGYILKNTDKTELLKAIRTVNSGQSYFSKEVEETIMRSVMKKKKREKAVLENFSKISRRELEVLTLIASEHTTPEIADKLFITPKTVESHRSSLLNKFNVRNSVGLIRVAMERGLI